MIAVRWALLGALVLQAATAAAAPLGATPLEPGLVGRSEIIFFESFESSTWYTNWKLTGAPQNTSLIATGFKGKALSVAVPKDQHYGTSFGFNFAKQGLAEPEALYFRYYLRFDPSWDGGNGGKLPGFGGTYGVAGWGGKPSHGDDGWSSRMTFKAAGTGKTLIGYYVYHADMTGIYGNSWFWTLNNAGTLTHDQWYCIEGFVKLNTPGQKNGILRGWVDGTLGYEKTDLNFRTVSSLKVERFWFDIYYGGTWAAPKDMQVHFDNVVLGSSKIGCYTQSTPDAGPPAREAGLPPDGPAPEGPRGDQLQLEGSPGAPDQPAPSAPDSAVPEPGRLTGDGCSCRVSTTSPPAWPALLPLLILVVVPVLRRLRRGPAR